MKRILSLTIALIGISMSLLAASNAKCLLQHQGSVKIYDASAIETAIKASADGDTIFLTEGQFPGFTVNKKITVRGAGQSTYITGNVSISISGSPTLTQTVLEGLILNGKDVTLSTAMKGVKIKQCQFYRLITSANNDDIIIERCYITYEMLYSSYIKGMTVLNSDLEVGREYSSTENLINFVNCDVFAHYVDRCAGTFINCIVYGRYYNRTDSFYNCTFVNTLRCGSYTTLDTASSTEQNCYVDKTCDRDVNTLENLGYFGNDGTIVGYYGGTNPYTLELAVPKVTESTLVLDNENKLLKVSLKVSAN